ncbi:MAG: nicotinate (nicotinamide) nucleotide adenylyltransferase [Candidatus Delongbacteria bacterium]|nr:nicotinate (nicotinamide) nucleotide adenylyltransferase [Candidatus Delongbacteria bacterium]MCG2760283.1 nicotinate (nicotinamide) nucleotide adenylyltransferase [Candidatus Delongbacteria bacterium]
MTDKIGLFGGSFDPIHIAHLIIASVIKDEFNLERIIFIPNFVSPFKINSTNTKIDHRLEMLKYSISDNEDFDLSDFEANKNRTVYTYETVGYFKEKYPDKNFCIIVGYDSYKTLNDWKNYSFIEENAEIIVALRPGEENCDRKDSDKVKFSKFCPQMNISSTMIRKMVANKLSIKYLVNEKVRYYINDKKLYEEK